MPWGARYCLKCLIRPFSKARLFLCQFALPILTSLSSLPPSGPSRGPHGSALSTAFGMSFRHCSLHSGLYQTTALQEIPTDGANWSNFGSQLTCMVGLSFLLRVILDRDLMRSLFSCSLLPFFLFFSNPFSSPTPPIYSFKLVMGSWLLPLLVQLKVQCYLL